MNILKYICFIFIGIAVEHELVLNSVGDLYDVDVDILHQNVVFSVEIALTLSQQSPQSDNQVVIEIVEQTDKRRHILDTKFLSDQFICEQCRCILIRHARHARPQALCHRYPLILI